MINRKYESNLKQAMCDEVLFKKDVSQKILSYTSVENGMGHIFYDLLSKKDTLDFWNGISTSVCFCKFINISLKMFSSGKLVIGLLYN